MEIWVFHVPRPFGARPLAKAASAVQRRRREARFFRQFSSEKIQKIFGKKIDGVRKRVLLRPSQDGVPAKADDTTNPGGESSVPSTVFLRKFFRKFSGKRLTKVKRIFSMETFPFVGSSLKFTLCD
jgi:hypothetical protein